MPLSVVGADLFDHPADHGFVISAHPNNAPLIEVARPHIAETTKPAAAPAEKAPVAVAPSTVATLQIKMAHEEEQGAIHLNPLLQDAPPADTDLLNPGCAPAEYQLEEGLTICFSKANDHIGDEDMQRIYRLAEHGDKFRIEAHSYEPMTNNVELSTNRALSVKLALLKAGAAPEQIISRTQYTQQCNRPCANRADIYVYPYK